MLIEKKIQFYRKIHVNSKKINIHVFGLFDDNSKNMVKNTIFKPNITY